METTIKTVQSPTSSLVDFPAHKSRAKSPSPADRMRPRWFPLSAAREELSQLVMCHVKRPVDGDDYIQQCMCYLQFVLQV
jgi:hypothetical protein